MCFSRPIQWYRSHADSIGRKIPLITPPSLPPQLPCTTGMIVHNPYLSLSNESLFV